MKSVSTNASRRRSSLDNGSRMETNWDFNSLPAENPNFIHATRLPPSVLGQQRGVKCASPAHCSLRAQGVLGLIKVFPASQTAALIRLIETLATRQYLSDVGL